MRFSVPQGTCLALCSLALLMPGCYSADVVALSAADAAGSPTATRPGSTANLVSLSAIDHPEGTTSRENRGAEMPLMPQPEVGESIGRRAGRRLVRRMNNKRRSGGLTTTGGFRMSGFQGNHEELGESSFVDFSSFRCYDECSPGGTNKHHLCTERYCDAYKPGGNFHSRCRDGAAGHQYAKAECAKTCGLCTGSTAAPTAPTSAPTWAPTVYCNRTKNPARCDLPHNATSYDKIPKGDKHFSCDVNCGGSWAVRHVTDNCKTQTTVGNKRSWTTCDSCKDGYVLEVKFAKSKAGYCKPFTKEGRVACAQLDSDDLDLLKHDTSAPPGDNILCTKSRLTSGHLFISKLKKTNPGAYRYFEKQMGHLGGAVARCEVAKHTACRGARCAVKKTVKCRSVCPIKYKHWEPHGWTLPENSPDCDDGREFCKGTFNTTDGQTQSSGAFACHLIAMTA